MLLMKLKRVSFRMRLSLTNVVFKWWCQKNPGFVTSWPRVLCRNTEIIQSEIKLGNSGMWILINVYCSKKACAQLSPRPHHIPTKLYLMFQFCNWLCSALCRGAAFCNTIGPTPISRLFGQIILVPTIAINSKVPLPLVSSLHMRCQDFFCNLRHHLHAVHLKKI